MSTSAWEALAASVVSGTGEDPGMVTRMSSALRSLGLEAEERRALEEAIAGREDPAGLLLRDLVATAYSVPAGRPAVVPAWDVPAMEEAIAAAEQVRKDPGMAFSVALAALPPDRAGDLVLDLVRRAVSRAEAPARADALAAAVEVSLRTPMTRLPVADLVEVAGDADAEVVGALGVILGQAPRTHVLRGLASALEAGSRASVPALVDAVRWPEPAHTTGAEPPPAAEAPVYRSGPVDAEPAPPRGTRRGRWWRLPSWGRGSSTSSPPVGGSPGPTTGGAPQPGRTAAAPAPAHPRIDLRSGTARPDVVVVGQAFTVTVGLAPRPSHGLISAGAITVTAPELELEAVLVHDPMSLTVHGRTRLRLRVTDAQPYPEAHVTVSASYLAEAAPVRRIGVQYLHAGQVVGMAWRSFVAVDDPSLVQDAPAPPEAEHELLDLAPLLEAQAPDLVLAVVASDAAPDRWIWTVYSPDPDLPVPDAPNAARLDGDVAGFALATRRSVQYSCDPVHDYYTLTGRARRIGASMPRVVHQALGALLSQPGRTAPPSVLLLTEELLVPWELASLDPPVQTPWGGASAFLGAHAALGRWPLTEHKPRPVPRSTVTVRSAAVVTGDYTGVPGWGRLQYAESEAQEVAGLFTPPAARVDAELRPVIDLLRGQPPADLIHVALHGQFDHQGEEEGIVLVRRDGPTPRPQFLTPVQVENGHLAGSFVFLNACQVGSDERVLGSYGGFASTLLRVGAGGCIAPLWNVEDQVAADLARRVYADALGPEAVPVAEAVRRVRATYTEEAVVAGGTERASATLVAFQVFGHPRLTLRRET
jgi:hypothetical protein